MQKNSNMVQTVVLVVFGLGIILGVLFFSGKVKLPWDKPKASDGPTGSVTVWGVLPYSQMGGLFDTLEQKYKNLNLTYVEKKPEAIQTELVEALASGKGPDIFMMRSDQVIENVDRLYIIPFSTYPDTVFKKTFADAGQILLTDKGILGLPLFMNPMVMYYNRDLFTSEFKVAPPTTWDELAQLVPVLTKKDDASKIKQAAVALGAVNNITYPKELLLLKILQEGVAGIYFSPEQQKWATNVDDNNALYGSLSWYTGFLNPNNQNYSWNTSLLKDKDMFISGKLAMFFGYPLDLFDIRKKNPNLDFIMAAIPQKSLDARKTNYAELYSLGISKITKNLNGSVGLANILTSKETMGQLFTGGYYAPARRDLLSEKPTDNSDIALVYNSAIISKGFLDPNSKKTSDILLNTVGQINSGIRSVDQSVASVSGGIRDILSKITVPTK
jgi:ABC-type glycerol-3-phosphate transport system substrate-binding protein